jgi:hypothetical protein
VVVGDAGPLRCCCCCWQCAGPRLLLLLLLVLLLAGVMVVLRVCEVQQQGQLCVVLRVLQVVLPWVLLLAGGPGGPASALTGAGADLAGTQQPAAAAAAAAAADTVKSGMACSRWALQWRVFLWWGARCKEGKGSSTIVSRASRVCCALLITVATAFGGGGGPPEMCVVVLRQHSTAGAGVLWMHQLACQQLHVSKVSCMHCGAQHGCLPGHSS